MISCIISKFISTLCYLDPREGRLGYKAFQTAHYGYPQACARDCLSYPGTKCMSFNYDFAPGGLCELLEAIEGHYKLYQVYCDHIHVIKHRHCFLFTCRRFNISKFYLPFICCTIKVQNLADSTFYIVSKL